MPSPVRSVLLGKDHSESHGYVVVAVALGAFAATLAGYALGVFTASGGVVWIPFYAAVVGLGAGTWTAYSERGLVAAWIVTYGALLGYHAEYAVIGLSRSAVVDRLAYFFRVDAMTVLAVEAVGIGTVAFILGILVRLGIDTLQRTFLHQLGEGGG